MFWKCRCCGDEIVYTTHRMFTADSPPVQVWRGDHGTTLQQCILLPDGKVWIGGHPHFDDAVGYRWARLCDSDGTVLMSADLGLTSPSNQYVYCIDVDPDGNGYFGGAGFPKWKKYSQSGTLLQEYSPTSGSSKYAVSLDDSLNVYGGHGASWSSTNNKPTALFKFSNAGTLQWSSNLNDLVAPVFGSKTVIALDTDGLHVFSLVLLSVTQIPGYPQYYLFKTAVDGTHVSSANKTSDIPIWIKIAGNGDLLAATNSGGYKRYDSTTFAQVGAAILGGGNTFGAMCIDEDSDGNIYLVGSGTMNGLPANILKFDSAGNVLEIGYHGGDLRGVSVNPDTQEFAVAGIRVIDTGNPYPSWQ